MMLLALSVSALSLRGVRVMSDIEREAFEQAVTDSWTPRPEQLNQEQGQ